MITRIFTWRKRKYSRVYDSYMAEGRPDIALSVAVKRNLGKEPVSKAAEKLYDMLINSNNFTAAESIAERFNLSEDYLKYAQAENLRLMASQLEDGSYMMLDSASELRKQADLIEESVHVYQRSDGHERFVLGRGPSAEEASDEASRQRFQEALKLYESGSRMLEAIGLAIYESELRLGNKAYAEMVAKGYGIREEDRQRISELIETRKRTKTE